MPGHSCSPNPMPTRAEGPGGAKLSRKRKRGARGRAEAVTARRPARAAGFFDGPLPRLLWLTFGLFVTVGLLVYGPALQGAFISDDWHYVERNEYIHTPSVDNLIAIWNPTSEVTVLVENYAPVHLMLHVIEWQLFGPDVLGYHVVNVVLHALAAMLLIPIYLRSGIGRKAALLGAALFMLHPANVESVAWISQLKSSTALVLSLLAILLHPRRPILALVAFAFALFAKPFSAFALPIVAILGWRRLDRNEDWHWHWLLSWVAVAFVFAAVEMAAFSQSAGLAPPLYEDLVIRYSTIFSVILRYLLMAALGIGLSIFHEPPPVESFLDPWFVLGVLAAGLLVWRLLVSWRRPGDEPVYWLWAAISFAPLSGLLPLPYPIADRYLYFVLPGLIGAMLLFWQGLWPALSDRLADYAGPATIAGRVALGLLLAHFAVASHGRAAVFQNPETLMADSERNYPNGAAANTRKAHRAAMRGDHASAIQYLRAAHARGYNRVDNLISDPAYASMQNDPDFVELKFAMADDWIRRLSLDPAPSHYTARSLAQAYIVKGELPAALALIVAASERPGPIGDELRADAEDLRRQIALMQRLSERAGRSTSSP